MTLPTRCSHQEKYFSCTLPPSYIISIQEGKDEFLVGVFCERHSREFEMKLASVLRKEDIPGRQLKTDKLRFVSTECIRTCATNQPKPSISLNDRQTLNGRENS
ncbi:MAG: hypothetical protein WBX01_01475 [Nitrososphaeraceae archaeon]